MLYQKSRTGLGFLAVVIDLLFDFETYPNFQNWSMLLINLQQNRRVYDRKCNYDSHKSRSGIAKLVDLVQQP